MVERNDPAPDPLTVLLKATADPTRRAILTLLAQEGPARVTDIAGRFDTSLNAVSKHIKVLENAGLVTRRTDWREHLIEVRLETLGEIDRWFAGLRSIWAQRLDALDDALALERDDDDDHD
ncbi:transcriptional regulator, ArsR family protein [Oceanicola granulosus HTCC2516]|uniref:Transcriptional regulator, ArsR family protein n=1 Tax=Oceanicola granulosus (strain ATCC BAA-861 / DSM 15982 / KCTC 12143 / HTCC2516) TaxID=314256 RepID=Q2CJ16_OCEGH|nr:metalloregulator ArsR/SmtB family transcription factor [Oceanicola granulosus]EAR52784.1 transcriptional regulator, ArsR family protein [Oceanicola granulosus HTCC2516]